MLMPFVQCVIGRIDIQILQVHLLIADDHVDVVFTAQAVIGDGQQAVDVRRQIDARDFGAFVYDYVQEPRILMSKTIVVLAPDG